MEVGWREEVGVRSGEESGHGGRRRGSGKKMMSEMRTSGTRRRERSRKRRGR